jgi:ubiquinol-cytochrome c reductase cytochrome b subunit
VGFLVLLTLIRVLGFFLPTVLGDPENFIPANSIVTPVHIIPEWYFLFAYAILRSIPRKLGGVIALVISIAVLYFLPLAGRLNKVMPTAYTFPYQLVYWTLIVMFIILTWLGACPIEDPYLGIAGVITVLYFSRFGLLVGSFYWSKLI